MNWRGACLTLGIGLPDHWIGLQGHALKIGSKLISNRDFRNLTGPRKSLRSTASRWGVEYSEEKSQIREKARHTWKGSQLSNMMWKCFLTVTAWDLTHPAWKNRKREKKDLRAQTTFMILQGGSYFIMVLSLHRMALGSHSGRNLYLWSALCAPEFLSETQGGEGGFLFSVPALWQPAVELLVLQQCSVCSAGRGDLTGTVSFTFCQIWALFNWTPSLFFTLR